MFLSSLKWIFRPQYDITPSATSVDEGASITYNVKTFGITNQTLYWTINLNGSSASTDFTAVSGSFALASNAGSFTVTTVQDQTTEGSETFYVEIRTGSITGPIVQSTIDAPTTINDTSLTPAVTFTTAPTSIDETGTAITYSVSTTNFPSGTLYWDIAHGTTSAADFSAVSGSFTVTASAGSFTITPLADATTEGNETFTINVRTTSNAGTIRATTATITLNDTSLTPAAAFSTAPSTITESGTANTYSVTTTNYPSGTLYWTINHITTAAADFSAVSGSFTITASAGSFSVTALADTTTEGNETFTISVRLTSISGTVLATTGTITISDTSLTLPGQVLHTGTGNVSWVCPAGVTSVSICCIGGGGGGVGFNSTTISQGGAGGGGGVAYRNNVAVTPGVTYFLYMPPTATGFTGGNAYFGAVGTNAGNGSVAMFGTTGVPSTSLCAVGGGKGGRGASTEGTPPYNTQGLYRGGVGGGNASFDNTVGTLGEGGQGGAGNALLAAGGGGAGGYGTKGGEGAGSQLATPGAGGGSGAAAGGTRSSTASTTGAMGGGSSILGTSPGGGTLYGAGGAAGFGVSGLRGGNGAVRIMWPGNTRSYPATGVANQ